MIGRMVLLSVFALVFLLALGLNRYLNRVLAERRAARLLTQGLFVALIPALLVSAAVIAVNPAVPYFARDELTVYVYLVYAGAGVALVSVAALAAVAGVIAVRRGEVRRLLKRSVGFVRRFGYALKHAGIIWTYQRATQKRTAPSLNLTTLFRDYREPTAFGDYLGREYMTPVGRDETKLDPFALDNGPRKTGAAHFSLEDEYD